MKLHNEFTVDAPIEQAWPVLLDIQRVATCLPGATMEPGGEDGVYRGTMKVKLGPVTTSYKGTVRLEEVDEDTHTARMAASAKEQKGQGTAQAIITNRLEDLGGRTRVVAETDLAITGRPAQFGRGIMEDVAGKMLGEFAKRFEQELLAGDRQPAAGAAAGQEPHPDSALATHTPPASERAAAPAQAASTDPEPRRSAPDVLDLGQAVAGTAVTRYAAAGAAAVAGLVIAGMLRKRSRRGFQVDFKYRW
jgi:carbon monoxide dehydrogenase subunit G